MMIGDLIICNKCKKTLQSIDLLLGTTNKNILARKCKFCGNVEIIK